MDIKNSKNLEKIEERIGDMNLQGVSGDQTPLFDKNMWQGMVIKRDGRQEDFNVEKIMKVLERACAGFVQEVSLADLCQEVRRLIFDGITTADVEKACILSAAAFIERDPVYDKVATRLTLQRLLREASGSNKIKRDREAVYRAAFVDNILLAVSRGFLDPRMANYPLHELAQKLVIERDDLLEYMGLHTLYERYLLKIDGRHVETPQAFWMRISMGLALNEIDPIERASEFYHTLSQLLYIPSTPTLFHSGFPVAQLSSCYLTTVNDDLGHIFKCMGDNAQLSKWAGGIGTDWTNIRGTGSYIKGIKATSQGVIPYLKIANDVVVAITRSGIRRGGKCAYLEVWHFDIEDFLDLRRNTGDERRRTHDMNTANWIPDLFMKRVLNDQSWTLFSPADVPDLHSLYGAAFEKRYLEYEQMVRAGTITNCREVSASQLWRKMLTRLFETGHPWITFKDPCNVRSPQDHVGVVHSSNLCTEITLNTSATETAVCNLGSINVGRHIENGVLNDDKMRMTIRSAVRMLDNVIDLNFYPTAEARESNMKHRPIGLGMMGFQDALYMQNISFASEAAREFADRMAEKFSYYAIEASSDIAQERGAYGSFKGSKWDRGLFPLDTIDLLEKERGMPIDVSRTSTLDWASLKQKVKKQGMRNSNAMAMAPTATIATIAGCYPTIEPIYKNIYVKSNVSGEFTIVNKYLIQDLKKLGLWNQSMLDQLKYYDGDISMISSIPENIKFKYKTAFELDPAWMIDITAVRGKWIDQSQSHNVFMKGASGKQLHAVYTRAWQAGLKTTYYLRTLGATQIEKSTLDAKTFGFTQKREYSKPVACDLNADPSCESCQ
jgi:ribonucleoside-diphosphate reductase alpha chain